MSVERMAEVRQDIAQAQDGVRRASDAHADAVVRAQARLLKSKDNDIKAVGGSEDARKLAFAEAIMGDRECNEAREALRQAEFSLAVLTAELEALRDARREREISLAERQLLAAV